MNKQFTFIEFITESRSDLYNSIGIKKTDSLLNKKIDVKINTLHDKVFGPNKQTIEFPLSLNFPKIVKDFIEKDGNKLDPTNDQVIRPNGRVLTIFKYLGRAEAPSNITTEYQNFVRNNYKSETKLVISRNPGQVASASVGTSWDSCANPKNRTGVTDAWNCMPNEIKHGSLIAIIVPASAELDSHGEYLGKDILGRTLIKRNDSLNDKNKKIHTVFIPETSTYGKFPKEATRIVNMFVKKEYPFIELEYTKEVSLYNDSGNLSTINKEKMKNLSTLEIIHVFNKISPDMQRDFLKNIKWTPELLDAAMKSKSKDINLLAVKHQNININTLIDAAKNNPDGDIRILAINSPKIPKDMISSLVNHAAKSDNVKMRRFAIEHQHITIETLMDVAKNDMDADTRFLAIDSPKIPKDMISSLVNHAAKSDEDTSGIANRALSHPAISQKLLIKGINSTKWPARANAYSNPSLPDDILNNAIHDNSIVILSALKTNRLSKDSLMFLMNQDPMLTTTRDATLQYAHRFK